MIYATFVVTCCRSHIVTVVDVGDAALVGGTHLLLIHSITTFVTFYVCSVLIRYVRLPVRCYIYLPGIRYLLIPIDLPIYLHCDLLRLVIPAVVDYARPRHSFTAFTTPPHTPVTVTYDVTVRYVVILPVFTMPWRHSTIRGRYVRLLILICGVVDVVRYRFTRFSLTRSHAISLPFVC